MGIETAAQTSIQWMSAIVTKICYALIPEYISKSKRFSKSSHPEGFPPDASPHPPGDI
jgi:hypothetical protein